MTLIRYHRTFVPNEKINQQRTRVTSNKLANVMQFFMIMQYNRKWKRIYLKPVCIEFHYQSFPVYGHLEEQKRDEKNQGKIK